MRASERGHLITVVALIELGAAVNLQDKVQRGLHFACLLGHGFGKVFVD
jgi:ankyrin repeat protein